MAKLLLSDFKAMSAVKLYSYDFLAKANENYSGKASLHISRVRLNELLLITVSRNFYSFLRINVMFPRSTFYCRISSIVVNGRSPSIVLDQPAITKYFVQYQQVHWERLSCRIHSL